MAAGERLDMRLKLGGVGTIFFRFASPGLCRREELSIQNDRVSVAPLHLPASFARQIEREAEVAWPNECCGILYGRDEETGQVVQQRVVERIEPVRNEFEASERNHRFSISPQTLMQAEKTAGEQGQLVLGFYHSHPDAPARPSEYDREHAWPFYSYVIVSLAQRQAVDMTSWVLDEETKRFGRQDIIEMQQDD